PDLLILKYFTLTTPLNNKELTEIKAQLEDPQNNPRDLKVRLAYELVKKYYDEESAKYAQKEFENVFVKKEIPDDIPEYKIDAKELKLISLMKETGLVSSASEAMRLIKQGGVYIDGEKITDDKFVVKAEKDFILKVGKRKFVKIKV
ncbi:MAG: tyrosine--tRNA ligase, partial [Chlorobi bacterium]|nr:tyrosine--tRNA ligase [Chlorobiota bacterium]